ncbi:hypothetical protein B0G74_5371 [Paraburkholderia sp. BL9I2N2]|nr:hypothetical protein B0G74_5371 [Paraburkholderia sp. BL9I2N2]
MCIRTESSLAILNTVLLNLGNGLIHVASRYMGLPTRKCYFLARLPYQRAKSLSLQCTSTLLIWTTSAMLRAAVSPLSCINATMAS